MGLKRWIAGFPPWTPRRPPSCAFRPLDARTRAVLAAVGALLALLALPAGAGPAGEPPPLAEVTVSPGQLLFEEGRLGDGSALSGRLPSGAVLSGQAAACASCHRPGGNGGREGRIVIPPVTAPVLFAPGVFLATGARAGAGSREDLVPHFQTRPAYDDALLRRALREGVDAAGRSLREPMPRYALSADNESNLLGWLHALSASDPPGWTSTSLRLALVLAPEAQDARRQAVREVVQAFAADQPAGSPRWQLDVYEGGDSLDALAQRLESSFATAPPLAVLSGAGAIDWAPVEQVCARHRTPCVFPVVDLPAAQGDRHAVYLAPGLGLEARALAAVLAGQGGLAQQWTDDALTQRAAALLAGSARVTAPVHAWNGGGAGGADDADGVTPQGTTVLWLHPDHASRWLAGHAPADGTAVWLSAWLAPPGTLEVPPRWRARVHWISVLDPQFDVRLDSVLVPWLRRHQLHPVDLRAAADAFAACNLLAEALASLQAERLQGTARGPFSQEHLLDAIAGATRADSKYAVPAYRHLDLSPGQRFAVKSASVLAYPDGASLRPVLVRDRVAPAVQPGASGGAMRSMSNSRE